MNRVLIFDDDKDILELCSLILMSIGLEVVTKTNCENVINVVMNEKPDVILMDNWLPDTGGVKATQILKSVSTTSHLPIIFFTASNDSEKLSQQAGAEYFLQKPFDIDDLLNTVTRAINRKS